MIQNYLKIALRQLLKNKVFSIINILGLAIGMAAVMLILIWVKSEVTFDNFHTNKDRIYELWNKGEWNGEIQCWNTTPKVAATFLRRDYPEVDKVARMEWSSTNFMSVGDKKLSVRGNIVDPEFLDIFSFPLMKGNPKELFKSPNTMAITEKMAKKFFGDENPVGKTITRDNKDNFLITGVLKDLPLNTRFNFEYLIPWSYLIASGGDDNYWGNNSVRNYVMLKENVSLETIQKKVGAMRKKYQDDYDGIDMFLYPISRWQLYSNFEHGVETGGRIELVRMFSIISGFILLIACINFMNLSTARSEKRAKEVGIRKTVGALKSSLIRQFLGESVLLVCISFIMALLLVQAFLPVFNTLVGRKLLLEYNNFYFWLSSLAFVLLTGCLAGFYPAFFLSSFKPVAVLKGTFKAANALITPRKILVVVQFSFAIALIICTIVVKQQINHAQNRYAGYEKENLTYHFLSPDLEKNYEALKTDLISNNLIESMCKTSSPICQGWSDGWGFEWEGKDPKDKTNFDRYSSDENFIKTIGLKLISGRDFDLKKFPTDSNAVLINESALKAMKFKEPLGQIIKDGGNPYHVIGVFKDFILNSPYYPTAPMLAFGAYSNLNVIHMRLKAGSDSDDMKKIEAIYKKYNPSFPFQNNFVDEEYKYKFESNQRISVFSTVFAGLTIFISCLGLFGLATYMAENRIKEIGIRKVLGASVANITSLLAINFLKLIVISIFIATPFGWWFMNKWLSDFPYRVSIQWWVFVVAGICSIGIALFTVSFQSIRAALSNPVKNLRTE